MQDLDSREDQPLGSEQGPEGPPPSEGRFYLKVLLVLGLLVGGAAAVLVPNFLRAQNRGQFTACKANLKNLSTALEMYASDHGGLYPRKLDLLVTAPQSYLRQIPTCPAAGKATYAYDWDVKPDRFTVFCRGDYHGHMMRQIWNKDSTNFPQYTADDGLVDHP
jgi:type II secretory pathway pseudopilin PulG